MSNGMLFLQSILGNLEIKFNALQIEWNIFWIKLGAIRFQKLNMAPLESYDLPAPNSKGSVRILMNNLFL